MFLKGKINPLPTIGDRAQMKRMAQVADRITRDKRAVGAGHGPARQGAPAAPQPEPAGGAS
jgi:hypothetical protein